MPRMLITSVGTSLLTNRDRPWGGWDPRRPLPDSRKVDDWLAKANPAAASAETNTWRAVDLDPQDRVVLLHSDTPEGRYCAERLRTYLEAGRCREVSLRCLAALAYHTGSFAQRGLRSLVSEAIKAIEEANRAGLVPVLCATAGFKAETAFLNLLGALVKVEVYYIHEQFREIVRLPRLPLAWDAEFVQRNRDFFEWIDAEPRSSVEVENRLKGCPELRPLVEDDEDGNTYLNAAGDLLFKAVREQLALGPRATWPNPAAMTPQEKNGLSGVEHQRPHGWEQFVRRLCEIDCVARVRYDKAAVSGPQVKILDAEKGQIAVRYEKGGQVLPLIVETTARGQTQTEWVADYLRRKVK